MYSTATRWNNRTTILRLPIRRLLFKLFEMYEKEAVRVVELGYVLPAYDYVLKCSHTFNLLNSRGAISVSEKKPPLSEECVIWRGYVRRVYLAQRETLGYPLLKGAK